MNLVQRIILLVYLPVTTMILLLDHLFPGDNLVNYVKYTTMCSMFLWTLLIRKNYSEQKILQLAAFFMVLGNLFLVCFNTMPALRERVLPLGVLSFAMAYVILSLVYQKNFSLGRNEVLAAVLVMAIFLPVYSELWPYVQGLKRYGLTLFGVILAYMSWTAICTVFRGYYSRKVSLLIAISGLFILFSDLGVGVAISHPYYAGKFDPWLVNLIWGFYVPGWICILLVIAERKLYRS